MLKGFSKGGIHTPEYKISKAGGNRRFPAAGNRRRAVVATYRRPGGGLRQKGDAVRVGQVIGTAAGFVSSNIHAPVSGTVVAVDATPDTAASAVPRSRSAPKATFGSTRSTAATAW